MRYRKNDFREAMFISTCWETTVAPLRLNLDQGAQVIPRLPPLPVLLFILALG